VTVTTCGRICFKTRKINLSQVFAGQTVGIKQVDERIWLVASCTTISDISTMRADWNPFKTHSGQKCYLCLQYEPLPMCPEWTGH